MDPIALSHSAPCLPAILCYIDPGTGSYLLQLVVAGMLGTVFAVKMSWNAGLTYARQMLAARPKDDSVSADMASGADATGGSSGHLQPEMPTRIADENGSK